MGSRMLPAASLKPLVRYPSPVEILFFCAFIHLIQCPRSFQIILVCPSLFCSAAFGSSFLYSILLDYLSAFIERRAGWLDGYLSEMPAPGKSVEISVLTVKLRRYGVFFFAFLL